MDHRRAYLHMYNNSLSARLFARVDLPVWGLAIISQAL